MKKAIPVTSRIKGTPWSSSDTEDEKYSKQEHSSHNSSNFNQYFNPNAETTCHTKNKKKTNNNNANKPAAAIESVDAHITDWATVEELVCTPQLVNQKKPPTRNELPPDLQPSAATLTINVSIGEHQSTLYELPPEESKPHTRISSRKRNPLNLYGNDAMISQVESELPERNKPAERNETQNFRQSKTKLKIKLY